MENHNSFPHVQDRGKKKKKKSQRAKANDCTQTSHKHHDLQKAANIFDIKCPVSTAISNDLPLIARMITLESYSIL